MVGHTPMAHFTIVPMDGLFLPGIMKSPEFTCDITQIRGTGIVISYLSIVPAHINLHKVIFTCE